MSTPSQVQQDNEVVLNRLLSDDFGLRKKAENTINDYTRVKIREDGFTRRILPPQNITNDELDRQVDTPKPVKIVDKEPESPAAISVPLGTLPMNRYIRGPRYRVMFDRIMTPRFTADVDELRTWDMDIRQILSDNSVKDMLAEEDGKFIATINYLLGSINTVNPDSGAVQYKSISGGVTRDTMAEALKILPRTSGHLNAVTLLVNNVTIWDYVKWGRDEVGGDMSQDLLRTGFAERDWFGVRFIITIKRDLVEDGEVYLFADPKFIGKFYMLEDTTMYLDRRAFFLEFFAYQYSGIGIGHTGSFARVLFN